MTTATHYRISTTQKVAFTSSVAGTITNAVGAQTYKVQIYVDQDAYIQVNKAPTAVATDMPLPLGLPMTYTISPGEKVSALGITGDGTLYVTELSG